MMKRGFTFSETADFYASIAPRAFSMLGAEPVPFATRPHDWFTPANEWHPLMELFGRANTAVAETSYWPWWRLEELREPLPGDSRPIDISVNPVFMEILDEDEMEVVLLHEIAHAAGVWKDQHTETWRSRAAVFGEACYQPVFRGRAGNPYTIHYDGADRDSLAPTLDAFSYKSLL